MLVGRLLTWLLPGNHAHGQFPSLDVNWTYTLLQMNIKQQKWWDGTSKFRLQRLGLTSCQCPFSCWHSLSLALDFLAYSLWGIKLSCWRGSHGKGITRLSPAGSQWGIEVLSPRSHEVMNLFPNLISELGNMPFPVDSEIDNCISGQCFAACDRLGSRGFRDSAPASLTHNNCEVMLFQATMFWATLIGYHAGKS